MTLVLLTQVFEIEHATITNGSRFQGTFIFQRFRLCSTKKKAFITRPTEAKVTYFYLRCSSVADGKDRALVLTNGNEDES